jgi:hypothetical protein
MQRSTKDAAGGADFNDLTGVDHRNPIGQVTDDTEVVGDEQDAGANALAQLVKEIEDLGLDGNVERRGGFVGNKQFRMRRYRHGNHDALLHAAG